MSGTAPGPQPDAAPSSGNNTNNNNNPGQGGPGNQGARGGRGRHGTNNNRGGRGRRTTPVKFEGSDPALGTNVYNASQGGDAAQYMKTTRAIIEHTMKNLTSFANEL